MRCDKSFHSALKSLYEEGYNERIEKTLLSYKTSDVGFRLGGSSAEHKVSQFLLEELKEAGLSDVHLEEVPTAACEFKGAYVLVNGAAEGTGAPIKLRKLTASQISGYKGTGLEGITAPLIYVGTGRKQEYDAISTEPDYFKGKLVLIDSTFDTLWLGWQAAEATYRGAAGVILTVMTEVPEGGYFSYAPDMLVGQDGQCSKDFVPLVFISQQDGNWLKEYLEKVAKAGANNHEAEMVIADEGSSTKMAAVTHEVGVDGNVVTMFADGEITYPEDGGMGYNVLGKIKGTGETDKMILISAHQDAHLLSAADDTGAVAMLMTVAKAMMMSDYKPYYSIQFLITSSEEYGAYDTVYDWQHGMFVAMQTHPDWAGRVVFVINNEVMAEKGGHYDVLAPCDCVPFVEHVYEELNNKRPELIPNGGELVPLLITIGDDWTTAASGIPGIDMTCKRYDYLGRYHTTYDSEDNIDYELMTKVAETICLMAKTLDEEALPFSVVSRARELHTLYTVAEASAPETGMVCGMTKDSAIAVGADAKIAEELEQEIERYVAAAEKFEEQKNQVRQENMRAFNDKLIAIEKKTLTSFVGLGIGQNTVYPYQQTLQDAAALKLAIDELEKDKVDRQAVLEAMCKVNEVDFGYFSLTREALNFSKPAFRKMLELYQPKDTDWSSLGKMSPIIDLYDQCEYMRNEEHTDYSIVLKTLKDLYHKEIIELNARLKQLAADIKELVAMM